MADHAAIFFRDVALVLGGALAGGVLFWRLHQPVLLGYVCAGLFLSPFTPGIHVHDVPIFQAIAEIGVILLMFSAGIEFSIPELLEVKWVALIGAPVGTISLIGLGFLVGRLMGWSPAAGIAIGCIICVASTMVLMRMLMDRGEMGTEWGRVMVTVTLMEDVAVVLLMILLPTFGSSGSTDYGQVALRIGRSLLLLVPVVLVGWRLIPFLLRSAERRPNDELSLLLALSICLAVAEISHLIGLSLALGAFIAGLLLGNSDFVQALARRTEPIRDTFVAIFFVSVGMLIDPSTWPRIWPLIALLVAMVVIGKFVVWYALVRLLGYSSNTAMRTGLGLTQIGEFSFVLAELARNEGLISGDLYNAVLSASLVTILINSIAYKFMPAGAQPAPQAVAA